MRQKCRGWRKSCSWRRRRKGLANPQGAAAAHGRRGIGAGGDRRALLLLPQTAQTTDDAQVDGHTITPDGFECLWPRGASSGGRQPGGEDRASSGEDRFRAITRRHWIKRKRRLALAESEARSRGSGSARTREDVASGNSNADAQFMGSQADLARTLSTYEQSQTADLALAQANVDKSRANAELAKADLARYLPLVQKGEISKQQYDAAKANADANESALQADLQKQAQAKRNVEVAKAQLDAAKGASRPGASGSGPGARGRQAGEHEDRGCAGQARQGGTGARGAGRGSIEFELHGYRCASERRSDAQASGAGTGRAGRARTIGCGAAARCMGDGKFKETQLKYMRPGQKAEVHVDTYGKTFPGHVDSIAGATGSVLSLLPPENATGNYVKVVQRIPVKIVLDPISPDKAVLRPGMNVDATVITKEQ